MICEKRLVVFGAGGHGAMVADIASQAGWNVAGFVDDAPQDIDCSRVSPVLGDRAWLRATARESCRVALGIGDNYVRHAVAQFLLGAGIEVATIVSSSAVISSSATIGQGTVIMPGAIVNAMATIGEGAIVNTGAVVEHNSRVGSYAHLSPNSTLGGGVEIGEFAHIAIGAMVLPLLRIGRRSILGAGSVATRSIPDDVIAFGIPAHIQRTTAS